MLKVLAEPHREFDRGCVLTLGNFDGVHRGHQTLLKQLQERAHVMQLPAAVILFEPQPQEFFQPGNAPARLMHWMEKVLALQTIFTADAIEGYILTLHFEARLAALNATAFLHRVLLPLQFKYLIVGADFRFGCERDGDVALLQTQARHHHFQVEVWPTLVYQGKRVSSTAVRAALAKAHFALATALLGRPYTMTGLVIRGAQRGRTLGYPTANIALEKRQPAVQGVLAVWVHGLGASPLPGMANIGCRPTVGGTSVYLEVHLFDFNADIYDRQIRVEFVQHLRAEQKFPSIEALKEQLEKDSAAAKCVLKRSKPCRVTLGSSDYEL